MGRLSIKKIAKLTEPGRYGDGHGLYLQVASPTNRSWIFRYERDAKERMLGLGPLHTFTLEEARERARLIRQQLKVGQDPLERRKTEKARRALEVARNKTFKECVEACFNDHSPAWKSAAYRQDWLNTLERYAYPEFGELPVAQIDAGLVLRVLKPLWLTKTKTAKMLRQRIEAVLNWATAHGYRDGENPARLRGNLEHMLPKAEKVRRVVHHAALSHIEIGVLMGELRVHDSIPARALEFLILTAARAAETRLATWDEINLAARVWIVPAERMKGDREHRVPLSDQAGALLNRLPRLAGCEYVFPGARRGPMHENAMWGVLRALRPGLTVHGFRSTFRTWSEEHTRFPREVAEQALAHTIGSAVERAYRRTDLFEKRRELMAAWARYCDATARSGAIVPMRQRA